MSAHVVPIENFIPTLRMKDRRDEYTPALSHTGWEPPVLVQEHHYVDFIWWMSENLNLDPEATSVLMDLWEKPAKYEADFRSWMDEQGEAAYDRKHG